MTIHDINLQCHVFWENMVVLQQTPYVCDKSFLVEYVEVGMLLMTNINLHESEELQAKWGLKLP